MLSSVLRILICVLLATLAIRSPAYSQKATDFKDGLGYYYKTEGKLFSLGQPSQVIWLDLGAIFNGVGGPYASGNVSGISAQAGRFGIDVDRLIGIRDASELQAQVHKVSGNVEFYSYGQGYSELSSLAFCYISEEPNCNNLWTAARSTTQACYSAHGPFRIRLYPVRSAAPPITKLVLPDLAKDLSSGKQLHVMWLINKINNCNYGWLFQFPSSVAIKEPFRGNGGAPNSPNPNPPMPAPVEMQAPVKAVPDAYLSPSPGGGTPPSPGGGVPPSPDVGTPIPPPPIAGTSDTR
jgi:hypothetical protein